MVLPEINKKSGAQTPGKEVLMIETRLLNYFLAVAREQSITKAADSLHIAQPTLSKQMMELEDQLGKPLLIRGKKKITLTEEGAFLRSQAQEIMSLIDKTESAFSTEEEMIAGDVYLGCGETPIMAFITDIFKEIQQDYPQIRFHIYSGDAESVLVRLNQGTLDLCLLIGALHQESYNYINLEMHDTFGILMPQNCELAKKETVTFEDIEGLPLIFPNQAYTGHENLGWFGTKYQSLNIVATYTLIYNATFMVEQGMGYAFCLNNLVDITGSRDLTFRPFSPEIKVDSYIATKKYQVLSPAVKLFIDRLNKRR